MTYVKGQALASTGNANARDLQTGVDHVREAIRLQPDLAVGYQALSFALAQAGDYEGAMRAAERAVELSPSDPDTLEALAAGSLRRAYEDAVANAERALRQALYAAGRYEEADSVLQECLLRVPDERGCLRIQAAVLVRLDRLDEARTALARLRAIDPAFSLSAERRTERFGASPLMDRYLADLEVAGTPAAGQVRPPLPSNRSA
jgi:adenylate cyclase